MADEPKTKGPRARKRVQRTGPLARIAAELAGTRAEMRRVTWPSRENVIRWSGIVVAALAFFGMFVSVVDNVVATPLLVWVSGRGVA